MSDSLRSAAELGAERPLTPAEALGVMQDVARALAATHAAGRVHGALCAENIVVDAAGVARLCRDTLAPRRVSPEQAGTHSVANVSPSGSADARSDIYGLGAAIAGLLGDAKPPEPIHRLLATMTADDPALRPQTLDEVLLGIEACELMTGLRAARPGQQGEVERSARRLFPLVVIGLGLVVLVLALVVVLGRTPERIGEPPESHKPPLEKTTPPAEP